MLDDDEQVIKNIINTNLTGAILTVQALLPNLQKAAGAKIILIGSSAGTEGSRSKAVAFTASTFGLRGFNNALRENFRGTDINSTILNLGQVTTQPVQQKSEGEIHTKSKCLIPAQEVVDIIECIIHLSPATLVKEMDIAGGQDNGL